MLLNKQATCLLGKMMGLINGLSCDPKINELESIFKQSILAIQNKEDLSSYLLKYSDLKKQYLPNCIICTSPCGRSEDVSILNLKKEQLKELDLFIREFDSSISFHDFLRKMSLLTC